jgi:hypothetical protein
MAGREILWVDSTYNCRNLGRYISFSGIGGVINDAVLASVDTLVDFIKRGKVIGGFFD